MTEETRDHQFSLAKMDLVSKVLEENLPSFLCDKIFQEIPSNLITLIYVSSNFFFLIEVQLDYNVSISDV